MIVSDPAAENPPPMDAEIRERRAFPSGKDVSVVVQGPLFESCDAGYFSEIRRILPGCEIILSTWKTPAIESCDCDFKIVNEDPGPVFFGNGIRNNVNRQIVSTRNGLACATRRFALKLRSDFTLTGAGFLRAFTEAGRTARSEAAALFNSRVVMPNLFARNPARFPALFHPSDMVMFGETADLCDLWDTELLTQSKLDEIDARSLPAVGSRRAGGFWNYCVPEQYIFISYLRRKGVPVDTVGFNRYSPENIGRSESVLFNNFWVEDPEALGLRLPQHLREFSRDRMHGAASCYTQGEWRKLSAIYAAQSGHGVRLCLRRLSVRALPARLYFGAVRAFLGRWAHRLFARDGGVRRRMSAFFSAPVAISKKSDVKK